MRLASFPLGSTAARLELTRAEYAAGVLIRGGIEGLGSVHAEIPASGVDG
ncbi:hypothetical protein [Actinophytocola sediminis]